jgi:predicted Fe-Mo cluster-binding NifX family protein
MSLNRYSARQFSRIGFLNNLRGDIEMKIVISSSGPDLESMVDPRFGRAPFLLIIDSDTGELIESLDNSAGVNASQGAGITAAALVAEKGVEAILTGRLGPKAMAVIEKANIRVVDNISGTVRNAVDTFRSRNGGGIKPVPAESGRVGVNAGASRGMGQCRGMGMGRGMGGGQGRGRCRQ